jgi:hypothetical protein
MVGSISLASEVLLLLLVPTFPATTQIKCAKEILRYLKKLPPNRDDRIDAVHLWHLQVHERDVRMVRPELLYSLAPIRCFADQSHIGFSTEEYGYALPYESMIVNCKNPDLG